MLWLTVDRFLAGDPHAERRLSEVRRLETVSPIVAALDVMLAIRAGDLESASSDAGLAQLSAIRWYQGRLAELLPVLAERSSDNSFGALFALAAASAGDLPTARRALTDLCGQDLAELPAMYAIVETAYILGDAETSAQAYRLLRPFAHLPMMSGPGAVCFGTTQHALGVASLSTGELDQAVGHFDAAIQQNLALGHWPAVTASRLRYAQALTARAWPQDVTTAERELATATSEASVLGMPIPPRPMVSFTRIGNSWRVGLGRRIVSAEHSIGMFHLAVLTANPFQELGSVDLVVGVAALTEASRPPSTAEQARIAVGKAIRRTIQHISKADTAIGEHLRHATHTGMRCSYRPY